MDQRPQRLDIGPFGRQRADRDAHHPASVKRCRGEVCRARSVDRLGPALRMGVERRARHPLRLVTDAHRLQRHGGEHAPAGGSRNYGGEGGGVGDVAPEPRLQALNALLADHEPELQRPEAPAERNAPVAEILHRAVDGGLQEARIGRHDADEMLGVAHEIDRAVEGRAEPFMGIDDDAVRALDAGPHPAAFGQDHGAAGHRRIDMEEDVVPRRDGGDGSDGVERGGSRGAGGGDDGGRAVAGGDVGLDHGGQRIGAHGLMLVAGHEAEIVAAKACEQRRLVDRRVALGRGRRR